MYIVIVITLVAVAFAYSYYRSGDKRYNHDGIGKIVKLFQFVTLSTKPATKVARNDYVRILATYIENFNAYKGDIVGGSEFIKEVVYKRMTHSKDYFIFNEISTLMIAIANGASVVHIFKVIFYILKSGIFNTNEIIMKISLSATLCTLLCLPDEGTTNLREKALHYKLIRCHEKNPFLGVNMCPMMSLWSKIVLPKIVNTDSTRVVVGDVIKYIQKV
jgi:hypothetical protein